MSRQNRVPTGGIILIAIGLIFLLNNLDVISVHDLFHNFWPVILILFGIYIILKGQSGPETVHESKIDVEEKVSDGARVFEQRTFGDINVKLTGSPFEGGSVQTVFGKVRVDTPALKLAEGTQVLRVNTTFGEIDVFLDSKLPVKVVASNLMGSIEVKGDRREGMNERVVYQSDNFEGASARLEVICSLTFGEIRVW